MQASAVRLCVVEHSSLSVRLSPSISATTTTLAAAAAAAAACFCASSSVGRSRNYIRHNPHALRTSFRPSARS